MREREGEAQLTAAKPAKPKGSSVSSCVNSFTLDWQHKNTQKTKKKKKTQKK